MNKISLIFLFIIPITIKAQQKRQFLYAKVHDKIDKVCNAHIINLNTKQGTFTNEFGEFRILAKNNDSLRISFIGYKTAIIIIKNNHFGMLKNTFILEKETYELDEVVLKKHNLFGFLSRDMKQTPDDVAIVKSKSAFDFSMIDFEKKVISKTDAIDRSKAPNMRKETDPTAKFAGVGGSFGAGIDGYAEEKRRLRREIKFKEKFPKMLISEFGKSFFFKDLKIPEEKYLHFLEYCNPLQIEKLYKNGKVLQVIKILQQESKSYLKIINLQE
ncbi:carboxypeptidase-like regulatory domain-containing protein [Tenacibaculum ovolyticum]|uniref:carboxypeptidase-like regulatory domain-containing protein n=1 Tax=Tenacibaculum ovolyticum TaxID=104270 RepID=UPI000425A5A7|nr:carboxypeptidase-like regulatory domain-containing protein [Tenacibaculum ovolyticum]